MTPKDAVDLIQSGGVLAAATFAIWALVTRRVVTRGEFDRLESEYQALKKVASDAGDELRSSAATNARLVESLLSQLQGAEHTRRTESRRREDADAR